MPQQDLLALPHDLHGLCVHACMQRRTVVFFACARTENSVAKRRRLARCRRADADASSQFSRRGLKGLGAAAKGSHARG